MSKKIIYIFARDFNQWTHQLLTESWTSSIPKIWGKGLSDHLFYYTGRMSIWYRYKLDQEELKKYMIHKKVDDPIFQHKKHNEYKKNVNYFRSLFQKDISKIKEAKVHLQNLKETFRKLYLFYPLPIFLAGPWREEFIRIHGKSGETVIERLNDIRSHSEGVLKENDNFMRKWLGPKLQEHGIPREYLKLLSVEEIDNLVNSDKVPAKSKLDERAKGYFYLSGKIHPIISLEKFLKEHDLLLDEENNNSDLLKGTVAYANGVVQGKVKMILNSEEIHNFQPGEIFVTTMTAPDYLPIISKAKALITDDGGLTSHAAIIARELRLPTITGTRFATKILNDGDLIEVDTIKGMVRKTT
ncbi:hypothetical protein J4421_02900 [Candidatus Woesearchaeota archaeon]|nr:hypothetical protein [Candidatus Woesearchaeota archaeon]